MAKRRWKKEWIQAVASFHERILKRLKIDESVLSIKIATRACTFGSSVRHTKVASVVRSRITSTIERKTS